jgi:nitrate/nitrite transporter NarK
VRYRVVLVTTVVSVLLYLDRFCLSFAETYIKEDLGLTDTQSGWLLSAFFWSYAVAQVPAGWLSDRWGGRLTLTMYVLFWSLFTGFTGLAIGFVSLFVMRLGVGVGQAGAYPTAAGLVSKWVPFAARGTASSIVSLGGRIGGALAPVLTAYLITTFVPTSVPSEIGPSDVLNGPTFYLHLAESADEAASSQPVDESASSAKARRAAAVNHISRRIYDVMSPESREALERFRSRYKQAISLTKEPARPAHASLLFAEMFKAADREVLAGNLNRVIHSTDFYRAKDFAEFDLSKEAKRYRKEIDEGRSLSADQLARFNRLLLEAVYPAHIKKVYGAGWRPVMMLFGAVGLLVAALYWACLRNSPQDHPGCNEAEKALIAHGRVPGMADPHGRVRQVPLRQLAANGNLWLCSVSMFFTNIGWVFIVLWAPRYFEEVHNVPVETRGWISFIPIAVGAVGMYCGGWLTDVLVRKIGLRWGRALPIALSRFAAMAAYVICLMHPQSPWPAVAAFAAVAMFTDLGIGAIWAYCQDVGGRNVGSVLGWGNMWGNFGAAVGPVVVGWSLGNAASSDPGKWDLAFLMCAGSFAISGITALLVDARRPAVVEEASDATSASV